MRTAVVVGAGVGGLAVAGGLVRAGWQVSLIEAADRLRGRGGALLLWRNGVAALESLDVRLDDIAIAVLGGGVRHRGGAWLAPPAPAPRREVAEGTEAFVVHADDLHDALMARLGADIQIHTGTRITSIRAGLASGVPEVGAAMPGGRTQVFTADLIVAADGADSFVRTRLAPRSTPASVGYSTWRSVVEWFRAPKLADGVPTSVELVGDGQRFFYAVLGERGSAGGSARGGVYWVATAAGAARPEAASTQLSLLRRWFHGWPSPVGELLEASEADAIDQRPAQRLTPIPARLGYPVGSGGFALLGDAAHVGTPDLAQGACLAFEDAVTLCDLVRDSLPGATLPLALAEYTRARRTRVERAGRASYRLGRLLQAHGRVATRARDLALQRLPDVLLDRRITAITTTWPPSSR